MIMTPAVVVRHLAQAPVRPANLLAQLLRLMPPPPQRPVTHRPTDPVVTPSLGFSFYRITHKPTVWGTRARRFGIRAGTWVPVQLRRPITAGGTAIIVLHVLTPVTGTIRVLTAGSRLLAHAEVAVGHRLRLTVSALVTPDGYQLPVAGVVFDRHYDVGLPGYISHRRLSQSWFALSRSLVTSADQALGVVAASRPWPVATLSRAGRAVLGSPVRWRSPHIRLYIPKQRAFVQIQKAF